MHANDEETSHISRAPIPIPEFLAEATFNALVLDEEYHLRA
jgi:hypothetical protein